jgi:hypothetical protein
MKHARLVLVALAGCLPAASFIPATAPGAASPPPKPPESVALLREPPPQPARVLGIVDYGAILRADFDPRDSILRLRELAGQAGADAIVLDGCIDRLGCVPRAVAVAFGGTHVLQASELPSLCYPPKPQQIDNHLVWGPPLLMDGVAIQSTECQFRTQ